jgi:hypothetical protein
MNNEFKFFHGYTVKSHLDLEDEIISTLSQNISNTIDEEIINELTRRINGGLHQQPFEGPIQRLYTHNVA